MNSEFYIFYARAFERFKQLVAMKSSKILTAVGTTDSFIQHINGALKSSVIFEIDDNIKKLLVLTDAPVNNDELKLPFPFIFLDVKFTKEELAQLGVEIDAEDFTGILGSEGVMVNTRDDKTVVGRNLRLSTATHLIKDNEEIWFDTFNENINLNEDWKGFNVKTIRSEVSDKKVRKFIHRFFINFLYFINNPEVEYREHKRSPESQARRIRKGMPLIPSTFSVNVTGKLLKYVDEAISQGIFEYSHKFRVRGHWRELVSNYFKNNKKVFIPPYIKGSGILIEKNYIIREKDDKE
jgi:hypothetical protein